METTDSQAPTHIEGYNASTEIIGQQLAQLHLQALHLFTTNLAYSLSIRGEDDTSIPDKSLAEPLRFSSQQLYLASKKILSAWYSFPNHDFEEIKGSRTLPNCQHPAPILAQKTSELRLDCLDVVLINMSCGLVNRSTDWKTSTYIMPAICLEDAAKYVTQGQTAIASAWRMYEQHKDHK